MPVLRTRTLPYDSDSLALAFASCKCLRTAATSAHLRALSNSYGNPANSQSERTSASKASRCALASAIALRVASATMLAN